MGIHANKNITYNISNEYKLQEYLGEGAYGVVCSAVHKPSGEKVAIKKVVPFDKQLFCVRTAREIKLLNHFRSHENIVHLVGVQKPSSFDSFREIYLIQEYMDTDLLKIINGRDILSDNHIQYFIYQIMRGLKYIHSANVIHRDLKPSNILVNRNCDLKICDFGLARVGCKKDHLLGALTEYVATRWYRAPEVMLSSSQYTTAIDLWSVGCILAELFIRTPIFPGRDYQGQLSFIFQLLGSPIDEDLECIKSIRARNYLRSLPFYEPLDFEAFFNSHINRYHKFNRQKINPLGIDLLSKLLVFNPDKRIGVEEALNHPYLQLYHNSNDEPVTSPIEYEEFLLHDDLLDLRDLKHKLYLQVTTLDYW